MTTITLDTVVARELLLLAKGKNFSSHKRKELANILAEKLGEQKAAPSALAFGKHKGRNHDHVLSVDPTYLAWAYKKGLVENSEWVQRSIEYKEEVDLSNYADSLKHESWGDRD